MSRVQVAGTGSFLPGEPLTNDDLERLVGPLPADVLEGIQVERRHWMVDPATGERLWSCDTDIPWYMAPSLVADRGVVYSVGGRPGGGLAVRTGGERFRETAGVIVPPLVFLGFSLWLGLATPSVLREAWTAATHALLGVTP